MDLGATLCTRSKPRCEECPLKCNCQAFLTDFPQNYPFPKPKKIIPTREINWLIIQSRAGEVLLEKRPNSGIWGGLWSFPEAKLATEIDSICNNNLYIDIDEITVKPTFGHTFSHFKLDIHPHLISCSRVNNHITENNNVSWYRISDALQLGLPAPVKTFLQSLP